MNSTVLTLIKIQLKSSLRLDRARRKSVSILKAFMLAIVVLALLLTFVAIYVAVTFNVTQTVFVNDEVGVVSLKSEFLTFTFVGFHVIQILFLLPILIKHLKIGDERETLLRLPVTAKQIFVARIVTIYIFEALFAVFTLLPILIAFGIVTAAGALYWAMLPLLLIMVPVLPFFVAILLIVPISIIMDFLKAHRNIMIVTYLAVGLLFVSAYVQMLTEASYLVLNRGLKDAIKNNYGAVHAMARKFFYHKFFSNAVIDARVVSIVVVVVTSLALAAVTVFVARRIYQYYYSHDITRTKNIKIKDRTNPKSPTRAYLVKELKNISRSSNYIFQFLVFVVIMPLFVFMCVKLAGIASMETFKGGSNNPNIHPDNDTKSMLLGIALLTFLAIIPLANSFAAISISREGGNIYQCKIMPLGFRRQVMIKAMICYVPVVLSIIISVILIRIPQRFGGYIVALPTTTTMDSVLLFFITAGISLGLVSMGMLLDLRSSVCKSIGNGEVVKTNRATAIVLFVGLLLAVGMGVPLMLSRQLATDINLSFWFCVGSVAFGGIMFALLYTLSGKMFAKVVGA